MNEPKCSSCRHYWPHGTRGTGDCRRHAPVVTGNIGQFPQTSDDGRCGDYSSFADVKELKFEGVDKCSEFLDRLAERVKTLRLEDGRKFRLYKRSKIAFGLGFKPTNIVASKPHDDFKRKSFQDYEWRAE